jgi:hypothetical protein
MPRSDPTRDVIWKLGEQCTGMQGFLMFCSFGGGAYTKTLPKPSDRGADTKSPPKTSERGAYTIRRGLHKAKEQTDRQWT